MKQGDLQTFGQNLRKARLAQNLTKDQLSEMAGISTTFYSNLERGSKMVSIHNLMQLAQALGVSTDYLLYGDAPDRRIQNICVMLQDQPAQTLEMVEAVIRACLQHLPGGKEDGGTHDGPTA